MFEQKVLSASKIPMKDVIGDLRYRQQKFWREADALSPRQVNSDLPSLMRKTIEPMARAPFYIPSYLFKDLERTVQDVDNGFVVFLVACAGLPSEGVNLHLSVHQNFSVGLSLTIFLPATILAQATI
eukprot:146135-Pelagomonas_calceolata.AAC.1